MTCYQWPTPILQTSFKEKIYSFDRLYGRIKKIELFFEEIFSMPTLLLPSGRACISAVLKINNISRENIVWAPKWSSHCVWNNITYFSTPSISLKDHPNVFLNVHKWGYTHYLNTEYNNCEKCIVIEDSVDSLIDEKYALFPNNGDYEIISLNNSRASVAVK